MNDKPVIEWAPFRLAEHVSEEELMRASDGLQRGFLEKQPGFLRRELLRGGARSFVDLVYWRDQASADQAMSAVANSPTCHEYFKLMAAEHAEPGAGVLHFTQLETYG